jgi:hypothetical protein
MRHARVICRHFSLHAMRHPRAELQNKTFPMSLATRRVRGGHMPKLRDAVQCPVPTPSHLPKHSDDNDYYSQS